MKICYLFILCLLSLLTTSGTPVTRESTVTMQSLNAESSGNSQFINVSGIGSPFISGDIYCAQDTQYTFTFGFDGSGTYDVFVGDKHLTTNNGSPLRTFTVNMKAGYTRCSVQVSADTGSFAYGRLTITKIAGSTSWNAEGYIDLVAYE